MTRRPRANDVWYSPADDALVHIRETGPTWISMEFGYRDMGHGLTASYGPVIYPHEWPKAYIYVGRM